MDDAREIFVDGMGAAAATSGILTQLEGRIFALLYLQEEPLALEDVAAALGQSKSNISVNIRGLVDWHLVRRVRVPGSRKDHYEAATNLWRVMQEIMERRFRWNLRQVLATVDETMRAVQSTGGKGLDRDQAAFVPARLAALRAFFSAVDLGLGAFAQGKAITPEGLQKAVPLLPSRVRRTR